MKPTPLRVYSYAKCSTCRSALKFLDARGVPHEVVPIRDQPPTVAELRRMLAHTGSLQKLFNSSGEEYKALNMKARLPKLSEAEALELLSKNGRLVKRPFALGKNAGAVGFREEEWERMVAAL